MSSYSYYAPANDTASSRMTDSPLYDTPAMAFKRIQQTRAVQQYPDVPDLYAGNPVVFGFGDKIDMRDFKTPPEVYQELAIPSNDIDYRKLGKIVAEELRNSPIVVESQVNNNLDINVGLDSETLGRKLTPVVSKVQAKNAKFR